MRRVGGLETEKALAVVTGASGGIGRAIADALAAAGHPVLLIARRQAELNEVADAIRAAGGTATAVVADLSNDATLDAIAAAVAGRDVDVLVHCAAGFTRSSFVEADPVDFDRLFKLNVRVPMQLTQRLLPNLIAAEGQIAFINSSVGIRAGRDMVIYGATKHALRAVADTLRLEVNEHGVRVLSVYCGRVATPMQASIFAAEQRDYRPELLTQPEDIASALLNALNMPRTTEMTDLHVRPAKCSY